MGIVPGVIINQYSSIGHRGHLVAIVPPSKISNMVKKNFLIKNIRIYIPGKDLRVRMGVLTQPEVGLAIVIVEHAFTIRSPAGIDHNGGRGVCEGRNVGGVVGKHQQENADADDDLG